MVCYDESIRHRFKGGIDRPFISKDGLKWVVQTHGIDARDLSTIEILISKLAFNIQTLLPDFSIAGIVILKLF
jgi:hypothetical protein